MKTTVNTKLVQDLERSGLSDKASLVYSALLELGGGYPSRIAEVTHLNRSTVYKILIDLSIKGLVNEVDKDKKLYYQVERPQQLLHFAKTRKELSDEQYKRVKELIPIIEDVYSLNSHRPKIRFFENKEGLESIFIDQISAKEPYEMLGFANTAELVKFITPQFIKWYVKEKERKNITTRGIVPDTEADRTYNPRMYMGIKKKIWLNLRYIPKHEFPFNGEITIYGKNKVSIINFDEHQLVGIIIEDKAIHDMMTRIFELAWKGAK